MTAPAHGGTDAGPPPRFDFSTNANALGPSPVALTALRSVDPSGYPDPDYTDLRVTLATWHGRRPEEVVAGAGACELIHRVVRVTGGPVVVWEPTFGEYRYAAELVGAPIRTAHDFDTWLRALPGAVVAFLCVPNSPNGMIADLPRAAAAASAADCRLVVDLAYYPLSQRRPQIPAGVWQLWAPNKAHGVTGVRAGYLLADAGAATRLRLAPSWILSAHGVAFLKAAADPAAQRWVSESRTTLWRWRDELTARMRAIDVPVTVGPANFVLAHTGAAAQTAARLRRDGIRVRDATTFGLPSGLRLSAQPPAAQDALIAALCDSLVPGPRPGPAEAVEASEVDRCR